MWGGQRSGSIPPPPAGFSLVQEPEEEDRDPWEVLQAEGFTATNGFRTAGDVERIRAQGYTPATNGAHNRGDGVDLDHPKLSRAQQTQRLNELFGGWEGARVIDEGHHRHLQLPGWGAAPGTPGTKNFGLPPLPPGYEIVERGSLTGGNYQAEVADRIATVKQNRFPPEEEARLIRNIQNEQAPLVDSPTAGIAFRDEMPETVASKLKPEQLALWQRVATDPKSTPEQLSSLMKGFGFDLANAEDIVTARNKGLGVNKDVTYKLREIPRNPDGATGAAARGFGDPFNMLDEMGAVVDTIGLTGGRENVWNSNRSFGDILYGNIDQNRSILQADERDHFGARFGGQLASGVLLPIGGGARGAAQLAKVGLAEGALAGFGAGEGNPLERLPNTAAGAGLGFTGGYALGRIIEDLAPAARGMFGRRRPVAQIGFEAAPVVNSGVQGAGPTPAARTQPQGGAIGGREQVVAGWAPDESGAMRPVYGAPAANTGPLSPDPRLRRSGDIAGVWNPIMGGSRYPPSNPRANGSR